MIPTRAGFSLVEAVVALAVSSILVLLVGSVFLVQNEFYAVQTKRTAVHEDARSVTEVLGSELRSVMPGGITEADNKEMTIRSPLGVGVVCAVTGNNTDIFMEGGPTGLDTVELAGFAYRSETSNSWDYYNATWAGIVGTGGPPNVKCLANGADTTLSAGQFHRLGHFDDFAPSVPAKTDVVMFFRETRFKIQQSVLDPSTMGLFRAAYGDTLIEYVTGLDPSAGFEYRTGGSTYATSVGAAGLDSIDAVRVVAQARMKPETGLHDDVAYGWTTDFILPNVR